MRRAHSADLRGKVVRITISHRPSSTRSARLRALWDSFPTSRSKSAWSGPRRDYVANVLPRDAHEPAYPPCARSIEPLKEGMVKG